MNKIYRNIYGDYGCQDEPGQVVIGFTDEKGNWPERDKQSHPYSYDPICQYMRHDVKANGSMYHDRMQQWNWELYRELEKKHFNNGYAGNLSNGKVMEAFIRDYLDDQSVILVCIVEYCNVSDGYAYFRFDYYQEQNK